jgi:hypothetical protein
MLGIGSQNPMYKQLLMQLPQFPLFAPLPPGIPDQPGAAQGPDMGAPPAPASGAPPGIGPNLGSPPQPEDLAAGLTQEPGRQPPVK